MSEIDVRVAANYNSKPLRTAQKDLRGLGAAGVYARAKLVALGYAVQRLGAASVAAAAADQKAQAILNNTLENMGWGTQSEAVAKYIDQLQRATGVVDDELRPAFASLLRLTNDVDASQQLLATALDVSAGTGRDVNSVVSTLTKALNGQRKGLVQLGTGLDATALKTASFADIIDALNARYSGAAATAAGTYAGTLSRIKIAASEAGEVIGGKFLDALGKSNVDMGQLNKLLGMAGTAIGTVAGQVARFATAVAGVVSLLKTEVEQSWLGKLMGWDKVAAANAGGVLDEYNNLVRNRTRTEQNSLRTLLNAIEKNQKKQAALAAAAERAKKAQLKREQQLAMQYDVERAGLNAALMKANDADTKQRLRDLLALNQDNYSEWANSATVTAQIAANVNSTATAQAAATAAASSYSNTMQKAADSTTSMAGAMKELQVAGLGLQGVLKGLDLLQAQVAERMEAQARAAKVNQIVGSMYANQGIADVFSGARPTSSISDLGAFNRATLLRAYIASGITGADSSVWGNLLDAAEAAVSTPSGAGLLTPQTAAQIIVNVTNNGSVISQKDFEQSVTDAVNQAARSGSSLTPVASRL